MGCVRDDLQAQFGKRPVGTDTLVVVLTLDPAFEQLDGLLVGVLSQDLGESPETGEVRPAAASSASSRVISC